MRSDRPSWTARNIALARSHLDATTAVVSDCWADRFLPLRWRLFARCLRLPRLRDVVTQRGFAHLAARTLAYDNFLLAAMDRGASQAVVIGAGYDSRPLRLARPGVQFFEVDHPATQADKKTRLARLGAPVDDIRFVPVDLTGERCADALVDAGFDVTAPTVHIIEGVSMYFTSEQNLALLSDLRAAAAEGSTLAVDFASPVGSPPPGVLGVAARVVFGALRLGTKRSGETVKLLCGPDRAASMVRESGWQVEEVRGALALWRQHLSGGRWPAPRAADGTPIIVSAVASATPGGSAP